MPADNSYSYPYFTYSVQFTDFDFNPYPTRGLSGDASLHKAGFGGEVNLWQLSAKGTKYWPVSTKSFFSVSAGGVLKLPFKQPYIAQGFLGYGDAFLQGYENYIIDGVTGGYTRATIAYNVFNREFAIPRIKWFKSLHAVPVRVYLKSYANAGYAYNPNYSRNNGLNNKALFSTGMGIDLVLFTDTVFKLEWSFNQIGQNAIYLH
jgi:outer membrane protein assembly factor BamA